MAALVVFRRTVCGGYGGISDAVSAFAARNFGQVEPAVMDNASIYLVITALSICPLAVYNSCAAMFRAINDSRTTMLIAVIMNLINLVGNAILIYGAKIGVAGAAIATVFSRLTFARTGH